MHHFAYGGREEGFTLVELIMVIVIIGILAGVAVPKFINLQEMSDEAKCNANRATISSAIAMTYAATVANDPSQAGWIDTANISNVSDTMFTSGSIPGCPNGGSYTLVLGTVSCSIHGS